MAEAADTTSPATPATTPDDMAGGAPPGAGEVATADPIGSFLALNVASFSAEDAQAEIAKTRHAALDDAAHPYNDNRHPDYRAVQARINELYAQAYPGNVDADTTAEMVLAKPPGPPEKPEDYDLRQIAAAEGVPLDQVREETAMVKGWAHSAGFSQTEMGELVKVYNELSRQTDLHDEAADTTQADSAHADKCRAALSAV